MNAASYFAKRTLNFKLNLLLTSLLAALLIVILIVFSTNFQILLSQVGQETIQRDVTYVQGQIRELEEYVSNSARLIANSPGLSGAISNGDLTGLRASVLVEAAALGIDDVIVINMEGNPVLRQMVSRRYDADQFEGLVNRGMIGIEATGILVGEGDQGVVMLAGVAPIRQSSGAVVGIVIAGQNIDIPFLETLNLQPDETDVGFVTTERIISADEAAEQWLSPDSAHVLAAFEETLFISDELITLTGDVPGLYAYVPVELGGRVQGVVGIQHRFATLSDYENRLTTTAVLVVMLVAGALIAIIAVFAQVTIIRPINLLKNAAERMQAGDLKARAVSGTEDEIGQLSNAFNSMADQLSGLVVKLEERVSEAQTALERAEIADSAKSAFLASMSHELRTPLNAIINFSKFLAKGMMGAVNERQLDALEKVIGSSKHLLNLINDVLDMSKIESNSLNLFVENNVDLKEMIESVSATAQSLLGEKPVDLSLTIDPDLPTIKADRQRVLQVLLNIVSNACKFTTQGQITIQAQRCEDQVRISVKDTGPGIAQEDHNIVFQPFKQTNTGLRQGGGTGLGMPISKSLVEAHGGRLWLESEIGQGSTFHVTLPIQSDVLLTTLIDIETPV